MSVSDYKPKVYVEMPDGVLEHTLAFRDADIAAHIAYRQLKVMEQILVALDALKPVPAEYPDSGKKS